jgi:hypothetical protein
MVILIMPPHVHMQVLSLSRIGILESIILGFTGIQGDNVIGMQGIGVKTPKAAAVAAATIGFEGDEQVPKGRMFSMGTLAVILAPGPLTESSRVMGSTISFPGAAPKAHFTIPSAFTCIPIIFPLYD